MAAGPSMSCNCSLSHLLRRSIDLIDPGRATSGTDDGDNNNNNNITTAKAKEVEKGDDTPTSKCTSTTKVHKKKKVAFSTSCAPPNKLISASDILQAYELLMHAVSIFSSPLLASSTDTTTTTTLGNDDDKDSDFNNINASMSWEEINVIVDIYRALIVTSNLLLEFLPTANDKATDINNDDDHTLNNVLSTANTQQQQCCPMQCTNNDNSSVIPSLTPTIEKDILSTPQRCILLLQSLERICAVKAISQRHLNTKLPLLLHPTLINEGGDDVHDYDRSISDLYANYDWHDDGFLPHPFTFNGNDKACNNNNNNILQECCYRPQYHTDPPSSKHERSAYTRPWILGDRIVSLCLDDYRYVGGQNYEQSNFHNDTEWAEERETGFYSTDNIISGEDLSDANQNPSNSESANIEEDEHIPLNISPTELNDEEGCLFDIMLSADQKSANGNPINHPTSKKQVRRNAKERKKRKRQKSKRTQQQLQQQQDDATNNNASQTASQHVHAKEGFLLLVLDDKPSSILQHLHTQSDKSNQSIDKPKSIRVYAKLHPSGWLSIADSSVRWSSMEQQQLQPLSYRTRYFDLFVTTQTKCQPCIPDGNSTFQFELIGAQLLGASSLSSCDQSPPDTTFNNNKVDLLFSIDEGTGGDFMDGFEWVNAFTGAANANSLLDNIRVEWSSKE